MVNPSLINVWLTPRADESQSDFKASGKVNLQGQARQVQINDWPTPKLPSGGGQSTEKSKKHMHKLEDAALMTRPLTGWGTPNVLDHLPSTNLTSRKTKGGCSNLKDQVPLTQPLTQPLTSIPTTGWATPTTRDHKDGASDLSNTPINCLLGRQVSLSHVPTATHAASRPTSTQKPAKLALNPNFTRWLMGYPAAWVSCVPMVIASCRR